MKRSVTIACGILIVQRRYWHRRSWKAPIEGRAHSKPIVWGERIFLATAISIDKELHSRMWFRLNWAEFTELVASAAEFILAERVADPISKFAT